MSNPVLCRIVNIDFQKLRNLMIRNRIYADTNGKPVQKQYNYTLARTLHHCIISGSERGVYVRTDSGQ